LRLVNQTQISFQTRNHFMAIAANLMRQILVNHANRHRSLKRGGGRKVELNDDARWLPAVQLDMVILDEALRKLAEVDARQCQIVELRFFAGMTEEEIAEVLGIAAITVKRDWRIAKAMLYHELRQRMPEAEATAVHIKDRA
jgi:RNA polymerase sigma-70 factor, ECF subfamily